METDEKPTEAPKVVEPANPAETEEDKKSKGGKGKKGDKPDTAVAAIDSSQGDFSRDLEMLGNIDVKALENLNTDDLRKKMVTGIYLLEHCLFSQAGFEFGRVQSLRTHIRSLEQEIFKPEIMAKLTEGERLRLYRMCMNNMTNSLEFLSNLHKNVTLGIEAVNNIDRMKADRNIGPITPLGTESTDVAAIKQRILDMIAKKSTPTALATPAAVPVKKRNKKKK